MNDLEKYFNNNTGKIIDKWEHYFEVYDRHFSKYRGKEIVLLEIGTYYGGSLQMWRSYFGDKAKIYGIDINPNCKQHEDENTKVFIGSQSDREFLKRAISEIPPIDILIDDGGHTMLQQIVSFEELFNYIKPDGVYLCEDLHTSYWMRYGGGHRRRGTFIEYSKDFIDRLNAYHSEEKSLKVDSFTTSVNSLHYYDSMLVIEKRPVTKPGSRTTGLIKVELDHDRFTGVIQNKWRRRLNLWLSYFKLPFRKGDLF